VNQYEGEYIIESLRERGYEVVDFSELADIYIINTCTVTARADQKSRQLIRQAKRRNPKACVIVTGCLAEREDGSLKMEEVDRVVPNSQKAWIVNILEGEDVEERAGGFVETPIKDFHGQQRAFVKIEDGCDKYCAYCILPYVRGRVVSRRKENIIEEVVRLVERGFREIVLTGINLGAYGKEWGWKENLPTLLAELAELPGDFRIRLSSIEMEYVGGKLLEVMRSFEGRICPWLHIPLQSGSDRVLERMGRGYTLRDYMRVVERTRTALPDVGFGTDVMVGFPGERDEDFETTLKAIEDVGYIRVHVFAYSPRPGTRAEQFEDDVPKKVKRQRCEIARKVAGEVSENMRRAMIGREKQVLVEAKGEKGYLSGYTQDYVRVLIGANKELVGKIVPCRISRVEGDRTYAELVGGEVA